MIVYNLDKYINHHSLKHLHEKNKQQIMEGIILHYMRCQVNKHATNPSTSRNASDAGADGYQSRDDYPGDSSDDEILININLVVGTVTATRQRNNVK